MAVAKDIPPNTIRAHLVPGVNIVVEDYIRPCEIKRDWMDAIPQQYIYRCIPLLAANTMGWEILNPSTSEVTWNGGDLTNAMQIDTETPGKFTAASHFGTGMVTWYVPFLFRTSPDLGLLITGPANHEHNNAVPLDAFVRTDWLPFPFTMNWRITQTDTAVRFEAGEPICRILPYPIAMLNETKLEIDLLSKDPGFLAEVNEFGRARAKNSQRQQADALRAQQTGEELKGEGVWNAQYVKAKAKDTGEGMEPHQTIFRPLMPIDLTDKP